MHYSKIQALSASYAIYLFNPSQKTYSKLNFHEFNALRLRKKTTEQNVTVWQWMLLHHLPDGDRTGIRRRGGFCVSLI